MSLKTQKLGRVLRWLPRCVALAAVTSACTEGTNPTEAGLKSPATPTFAVVYDGQINQADSYVAQDITSTQSAVLQFSTPTYDPVVDGMVYSMQLPTQSESDHIEGGYGYDGSTRINEYNWGGEEYNSGIAAATVVNDAVTFYDASGNPIAPMEPTLFTALAGTTTVNTIGSGAGGGGGGYCPETDPDCNQILMTNVLVGEGSTARSGVLARPSSLNTADGGVLVTIPIEADGRHGELKKLYKKREGQWVLLTEDEQTEQTFANMTVRSTVHRDHEKYVFHVNPEKDKERAEWRKNHPAGMPTRVAGAPSFQRLATRAGALPAPAAVATVPQPHADFYVDNGPGQALVLVHGVKSDETTWFPRMEPWLIGDPSVYAFTRILVPSLQWRQTISYQASDLQGRASVVGANALFIGHSMGGLVSRKVGQANPTYPGSLVKGVVTIDSPHQGAIIAKALNFADYQQLINNLRSSAFLKYCSKTMVACFLDAAAAQAAVIDLGASFDPVNASSGDLQPNSAGLQSLNTANEPFLRGGIQNWVDGRFKWARLYGDRDHNPEEPWGGRFDQRLTSQFFLHLRHCHNAWWLGPASSVCGLVYSTILHLDESFERHIDPTHAGSDGIVTIPSQVYPNTPSTVGPPRNWRIVDGDSHVGALKTIQVRDGILVQLLPFYGLPHKLGR